MKDFEKYEENLASFTAALRDKQIEVIKEILKQILKREPVPEDAKGLAFFGNNPQFLDVEYNGHYIGRIKHTLQHGDNFQTSINIEFIPK